MLVKIEVYKKLNYKGHTYDVSNYGNVILNGKKLNLRENADGYLVVTTHDYNEHYRSTGVHRLVGKAFIPNDAPERNEINHKDYNRKNNHVDNLEWLTHAENIQYSICNKPDFSGDKNPNYGNKKLSEYYSNNPDAAKEKQGRPGLRNGRCRKIHVYKGDDIVWSFDYISQCCHFLIDNKISGCSTESSIRSQIDKCIRFNKEYKGYRFVKE